MSYPFVQAKHHTPTNGRVIDLVVVHDMEYPERPTAAEDCARYFVDPRLPDGRENRASAHYCVDDNSVVQCVRDQDVAYAAPRINHNGIHIEHAGYARQTRDDWLDPYSSSMLAVSARLAAGLCRAYSIPATFVDEAGLVRGMRGVTTHAASTRAFGIVGGHTDPGPNFPMDVYLDLIRGELNPTIPEPEDDDMTADELRAILDEELAPIRRDVATLKTHLLNPGATASKPPENPVQRRVGQIADKLQIG